MSNLTALAACAALVGTLATALLDLWSLARQRLQGIAPPDFALLGRWLAYLPRGRFRHRPIGATAPVRGERALGWTAHYLIGIAFAAVLLAGWGLPWVCRPTLAPALVVGIGSVAAPLLVMQPAFGSGLFARLAPRPNLARLRSVVTHTVFGLGLYLGGWIAHAVLARWLPC